MCGVLGIARLDPAHERFFFLCLARNIIACDVDKILRPNLA